MKNVTTIGRWSFKRKHGVWSVHKTNGVIHRGFVGDGASFIEALINCLLAEYDYNNRNVWRVAA